MKPVRLLLTAILVLSACQEPSAPNGGPQVERTPMISQGARKAELVPNQYIVVFRSGVKDVPAMARALAGKHRGRLMRIYQHALRGMALELPDSLAAALRREPAVEYVEQNQVFHATGDPVVQPNATFGLDRIDQRALPLSGTYGYSADGSGVRVYILDTGINFGHTDFGGRAVLGTDALSGSGEDCNGHGTHVAGTIGGSTYGVAKKAQLYAVRVLDCNGSSFFFSVFDGIEWVTRNGIRPAVANMSLVAAGFSATLNQAVANSIASGITYVVAAGNAQQDACTVSPASVSGALTVAASTSSDGFASFSNFGPCVDLIAPGVGITSDWIGSAGATNVLSGTSMAAPHASGAAALLLSTNPDLQPPTVNSLLFVGATQGAITAIPANTQNRLLYTGFINTSWLSRAPLRFPRSALGVASAGGFLYAIGGNNGGGTILSSMERYDPVADAWTSKAALPAPRYDGDDAAAINGVIYLPGGRNAAGTLTPTLYAYKVSTNTWSTKAPLPVPSGCGGSVVIEGQLYVFTGCTRATGFTGLLHRYNPGTNTWTARAAAPTAHGYPVIGVNSGKIYVAGGLNASGVATATLHLYTPSTNTWTTLAPMPSARYAAAGQMLNDKLYVLGGTSGTGDQSANLVYTPGSNIWDAAESMPMARRRLNTGTVGGLLYAIGGRSGPTYLKVVERFTAR